MADFDRSRAYGLNAGASAGTFAYDEGLRAYMVRVYNYMGIGLVLTGIVAYAFYAMAVTDNPAEAAVTAAERRHAHGSRQNHLHKLA